MNGGLRRRLYSLLLLAFPRSVRREYGREMTELFESQLEDARQAGTSTFQVWSMAITDALRHGGALRAEPIRRALVAAAGSVRRWRWWMRAFFHDVRYTLRVVARRPAVTLLAILTLALGIGANTAIFSAVNAVLLRPLPYPQPDRVMMLFEKRPAEGAFDNPASPADALDWIAMNTTFDAMAAMTPAPVDLTGSGEPVRVSAGAVTPRFFDVFGTQPLFGRTFQSDDAIPGKHRVVVLGHSIWRERFGGNSSIVGQTVSLSGVPHVVIGVLPETFDFPDDTLRLWRPLSFATATPTRTLHYLNVYGRLKPHATLDQARADMERVGAQLLQQYPDANRGHGVHVNSMTAQLKGPIRSPLLLLLGAVAFVLLIACVNVSNLMLSQAAARRREMAVRAAVGAGRARLAGQMLTESIVLGLLGGAAGLLVARWAIAAVRNVAPVDTPLVGLQHFTLEPRVLVFTFVLSLAASVLFGAMPAWYLARQNLNDTLKDAGRSPASIRRRLRVALVVSEIALASLLLIAAGLTIRSFQSLLNTEAGFERDHVLTFAITLPVSRYRTPEAQVAAFRSIESRLQTLPGVRAVAATSHLPLAGGDSRRGVGIEGREPTPDTPTRAHVRAITNEYLNVMGIRLKQGRPFGPADTDDGSKVIIVNDTMARRYWPGTSPIGKRLQLGGETEWREVIGVANDVRFWGLDRPVNPEMYLPLGQYPTSFVTFALRTDTAPSSLTAAAREQIRAVDPDLPVADVQTMNDVAADSISSRRAGMLLLTVFGGLALILAVAGIYGVMAHLVALRTSEIGIRMTLGAQPSSIMGLVLREGLAQALAGLAIGMAGGVLVMRTFRAMLFEVNPADPITIAAVTVLLLAAATLACILPARRAMRVDPVEALRS
jgi:putative ABC transport system permease protein